MNNYIHGIVATNYATASNNRGEGDGTNFAPLQTLNFAGREWTTVSAEAIRFSIRRHLSEVQGRKCRRVFDSVECLTKEVDAVPNPEIYSDDDVFGFMITTKKASSTIRKSCLEVERSISLTPYTGDLVFNATSDPKGGTKGRTSLYGSQVHHTAYRYGFCINPKNLIDKSLVEGVLSAISNMHRVGGNHSRNLYDFSPAIVVLRVTKEPAPRILQGIEANEGGDGYSLKNLVELVLSGEVPASELHIGGRVPKEYLEGLSGCNLFTSVRDAIQSAINSAEGE